MFKKAIFSAFALILFAVIWTSYSKPLFSNYSSVYEIYDAKKSAGRIALINEKNFPSTFLRYGESASLKIKGDEKVALNLIKEFNGEVVFIESLTEGISYYAYSKDIRYCETLKGKKINLHIFVDKNGQTTVGAPLIYGSF